MISWSTKRKFTYGSIVILALIFLIGLPAFFIFYKKPTCFDGKMNGGEFGIDCGGNCSLLCQSAFLPPKIAWGDAKFEKVAEGLYNVASYVINPNLNGAAVNVPYKMSLYDSGGNLITERTGSMTIPAHRNALAFEPSINVGNIIPVKAIFEFTKAPVWFKSHDDLQSLAVAGQNYQEDEKSSSFEAIFENRSLFPYQNIDVSVVLYDVNGNAIGFSRTRVDYVAPRGGRETASFTWPFSRNSRVTSNEIIPIITPIADK